MSTSAVLLFFAALFLCVTLTACTSQSLKEDTTGKLQCVGYCELDVSNKQRSIHTEHPDGTVTKEVDSATGLTRNKPEIIRATNEKEGAVD